MYRFVSTQFHEGARVAQWVRSLDLTTHTSLSPIRRGFVPGFVNYKKGCTRLAVASNKVYQLLAHGRWFSPGTTASSTTKTGRHDIAEILLKVALRHQKSKSKSISWEGPVAQWVGHKLLLLVKSFPFHKKCLKKWEHDKQFTTLVKSFPFYKKNI